MLSGDIALGDSADHQHNSVETQRSFYSSMQWESKSWGEIPNVQ